MNKNEKFVITINREVGAGGRTIGRKLAEKLGVNFYDKAIVEGLTKKFNLSIERIEEIKAQNKTWWNDFNNYYSSLVNSDGDADSGLVVDDAAIFETEKRILEEIAEQASCVIAGRTGFMVFRDYPNHLNIFIQASFKHRVQRVMRRQNVSEQDACYIIEKLDKNREAYIKKHEDTSRYDTRNYQLVLSMDNMTEDDAVDLIMEYIKRTCK